MNSKEKMNPDTKKVLAALKLPEDQMKLAEEYICGTVGEEVLEKFDYKDLSSLPAEGAADAMYSLVHRHQDHKDQNAYDDVHKLVNILFAIGHGTCYRMITPFALEPSCNDFFMAESEEMLFKYYVIFANTKVMPEYLSLSFSLYNFGKTDIELACMRKAIDCHTVTDEGRIYLLTMYFKRKYTDKFVDSLADTRKNIEESPEDLADLGRALVLNSIKSQIRIDKDDCPLLETYENMMINSLGSIFDKKIPASVLKDIQKAMHSDDMDNVYPLIREYGCERHGMELIGGLAYLNIALSSVFKNIVSLCFKQNNEVMLHAVYDAVCDISWGANCGNTSVLRIGGDFDKLFDIDIRVYIRWLANKQNRGDYCGNVLARQLQTNKDIYLEIIEEEIVRDGGGNVNMHPAVPLLEVIKKNDPDLYQSIIGDITKKYMGQYMENIASKMIKMYALIKKSCVTDDPQKLSDDERVKLKEFLMGRETLDAIYPIAIGIASENYKYRNAYRNASVEIFRKIFGDCEFTRRCAIVATFMGADGYLWDEMFERYERGPSEQKVKKLFAGFEKEGLSIEYQLTANNLILRQAPDPAQSEKFNDTVKYIFTRYLIEKREETAAAFYSASPLGQYLGLTIMEGNPEEYKQEILQLAKISSGFVRDHLLEIFYQQKNWEDDIIALLSSKTRDIRALAVNVLMYWQSEGADYTDVFTSILEREKTAKVRELLQVALKKEN